MNEKTPVPEFAVNGVLIEDPVAVGKLNVAPLPNNEEVVEVATVGKLNGSEVEVFVVEPPNGKLPIPDPAAVVVATWKLKGAIAVVVGTPKGRDTPIPPPPLVSTELPEG